MFNQAEPKKRKEEKEKVSFIRQSTKYKRQTSSKYHHYIYIKRQNLNGIENPFCFLTNLKIAFDLK